jgi:hypothetical protein
LWYDSQGTKNGLQFAPGLAVLPFVYQFILNQTALLVKKKRTGAALQERNDP